MLGTRQVSVRLGQATLLHDVTLAARPGEVLGIVGANGAGKSTLLRVLSGERRPTSGEVVMNGRPLGAWSVRAQARQRAVLHQESQVAFPFTAFEVVLLGRHPHSGGQESPGDVTIAADALRLADAAHLAARIYPTLSGGERQRVQLARALAQVWQPADGPGYLLLDEPTSAQDPSHQHRVLAIARQMAGRGLGVVAVLHDLNLASAYTDRVVLLRKGRVLAAGPTPDTLTPDRIRDCLAVDVCMLTHPDTGRPVIVPRPTEPSWTSPLATKP